MYTFTTNGKTVSIFPSSEASASILYLNAFSGERQKEYEATQAANCPPFILVAVSDPKSLPPALLFQTAS